MSDIGATPVATPETVTVRMYKGLLGDCFLLRIEDGNRRSHILIDCGVLWGAPDARESMRRVAEDILATMRAAAAEGDIPRIDLLVLTHEHWDHLSGFAHARDLLLDGNSFKIDQLWLAWTENPEDEQAKVLRQRFNDRRKVLGLIAGPDRTTPASGHPQGTAPDDAIGGLQGFLGPIPKGQGAAEQLTTDRIIEEVRKRAGKTHYLEPGEVLVTPGPVPLCTYVLGPPRDEKQLFKDRPSQGTRRETYLDRDAGEDFDANDRANARALDRLAAARNGTQDEEPPSVSSPFEPRFRGFEGGKVRAIGASSGPVADKRLEWLYKHYVADRAPCRFEEQGQPPGHDCAKDQLCNAPQASRGIEGDWMRAAGSLALKLDSDTNNTSVVLAFELRNGEVLLFAADAQVGNWESWRDRTYGRPSGQVTADDLLARTTLYKVGHHGSHNATLSANGLEKMTHPCLVALLSTNEEVAMRQGAYGWKMPWPDLKEALVRQTKGRLLRGDAWAGKDHDGTVLTREPDFFARVTEDPGGLWVEFRAGGKPPQGV